MITRWTVAKGAAEASAAQRFYMDEVHTSKVRKFWWALQVYTGMQLIRLVCLVKGHDLVDDDPGDPEVGPQPKIYCVRCLE